MRARTSSAVSSNTVRTMLLAWMNPGVETRPGRAHVVPYLRRSQSTPVTIRLRRMDVAMGM
jgi:hypothetical protein